MSITWTAWLALVLQIVSAFVAPRAPALGVLVMVASWGVAIFACITVAAAKGYPRWLGVFCAVFGLLVGPLMVIALPTLPQAELRDREARVE